MVPLPSEPFCWSRRTIQFGHTFLVHLGRSVKWFVRDPEIYVLINLGVSRNLPAVSMVDAAPQMIAAVISALLLGQRH